MKNTILSPKFQICDILEPFKSIAVVGNSPSILAAEHGEAIDAHDVVIRINDGVCLNYEKHVGTRTTIRFVGVPITARYEEYFRELKEDSKILTRIENAEILDSLGWAGEKFLIQKYGWAMRNAFSRLAEVVTITDIPLKNPRTGILILSMLTKAMKSGKKISLYGFEILKRDDGNMHFYNDGHKVDSVLHTWERYHCPMSYEFDVILNMRTNGLISVN